VTSSGTQESSYGITRTITEAFKKHLPEMYSHFEEGIDVYNTEDEADFIRKAYALCTNISIDYGIMEKAKNVYVPLLSLAGATLVPGALFTNTSLMTKMRMPLLVISSWKILQVVL